MRIMLSCWALREVQMNDFDVQSLVAELTPHTHPYFPTLTCILGINILITIFVVFIRNLYNALLVDLLVMYRIIGLIQR